MTTMPDTTENNDQSDAAGPASPPPPVQSVAESGGRWDARKTAIVAALAIVLCSAGAIGAAAALPRDQGMGDFGGGPGRVFIPQQQFAP